MVVQFSGEAQPEQRSPTYTRPPPAATPEQVRKKWDALLNVINNVSADAGGEGATSAQGPPLRAAQELLRETGSSMKSPTRSKRREWNDRHHLMYSVVNAKMQRNIRSYFDRPREIEAYGLRHDDPLRTIWQLDTEEVAPPKGTMRGHFAKFNAATPGSSPKARNAGSPMLPALGDSSQPTSPQAVSPHTTGMGMTGMSKAKSAPGLDRPWNDRHHVVFAKDNGHYHANLREYFERPRSLLV